MLREPLLEDGLADVRHEKVQGQQYMKRSLPSDFCIGYDSKIAWALVRSLCCGALLRVWLHCCGAGCAAVGLAALLWRVAAVALAQPPRNSDF